MNRLRAPRLPEEGGLVQLDAAQQKHARVLRLEVGERVQLFDGEGFEADARIEQLDPLVVLSGAPTKKARAGRIVLVQCLPKGAKLESIVRMATELGVSEIRLALSERCVSRPDEVRALGKLDRLTRIASEAARQSERADEPSLSAPAPLEQVAGLAPDDATRLVLAPGAGAPLDAITTDETWLVVGPEGGLAPAELQRLAARGFLPVALGPTVLRVETAAPVAVALVADRVRDHARRSNPEIERSAPE